MKLTKKIFIPAILILAAIIAAVSTNLQAISGVVTSVYSGCIEKFGWFFVFADICCLVFSLWLAFGPYRNVKLGGENCKAEFSTFSWAGMMFTTSCGAWLIVYGFLEPIYCSARTAFGIEPLTTAGFEIGQAYAHFNWGPNAWCIYVPISVAIGYVLYNRRSGVATIGEACKAATGWRGGKIVRYAADLMSLCGAVLAPVISIGTGLPLLVYLVKLIFGLESVGNSVIQIGILGVWILLFATSVFFGLQKGIKRLSNANVIFGFGLMLLVGLFAGLFKVFSAEINTLGVYISNYVRMCTYTDAFGDGAFVSGWTNSYYACYFVYMPLMGVLNAIISKGRRLKEIAFGQLVLCTLGCWVAMATFGNYSMQLQTSQQLDIASYIAAGDEAGAIVAILQTMPASKLIMIALLVISFIFLATTMDSSAFSAAEMTMVQEKGSHKLAPRWVRLLWASIAAIFAFLLVQVGGAQAVRSLCFITGLPLAVIALVVIVSTVKMLRSDLASECEDEKRIRIFEK